MKYSLGKPKLLIQADDFYDFMSQEASAFLRKKEEFITMLTSLAFIFLVGLSLAAICQALKLPRIIGMLITGILLGPYVLNVLDPSILSISSELRQIALIIILLKAGLSLNLADLKKVGRPAIMMACIPATFEILAYFLLAPYFLGITRLEAAVMGAVMGAVSPAVVVPRMVQLMDEKYGTAKSIPQMILAGASCDDIYVIVLFSTFSTMAQGGSAHVKDFINIPVSIVLGIVLGSVTGYLLSLFFETAYAHSHMVRNSMKVIVVMGVSFLLMSIETWLKPVVSISGLLAVVSMASVDIRYTLKAGPAALAMIFAALLFRTLGVTLCVAGTNLTAKEKLFCSVAYLPKATVQAAIGSVPMAMGLSCGQIVLSVAVLGILITAPLGAIGMDCSYKRLLKRESCS